MRRFAQDRPDDASMVKKESGCDSQKAEQYLIYRYSLCKTRFFHLSLSHSILNALICSLGFAIMLFFLKTRSQKEKVTCLQPLRAFLAPCLEIVYVLCLCEWHNCCFHIWMCKNCQSGFQIQYLALNFACSLTLGDMKCIQKCEANHSSLWTRGE